MLHWQLLKWLNGLSLGAKVICISAIGHFWILFSLFFLYKGSSPYSVVVTSTMINTDLPVVFMPLHKSLKKNSCAQKKVFADQKGIKSTQISKSEDCISEKPITEKGKTIIAESVIAKKQKKLKGNNKKQTKKEVAKKTLPKKKVEPEKKEESIKQAPEPIKPLEESKPVEKELIQPQNSALDSDSSGFEGENILYIGQQEMEALQLQDYIQQEMAQHWRPPSGMRKDLTCVIKIVVAFDGMLASIDFEQSSGVLLFDGAAKKAALQLQPPRWAYGKELSITFKP